MFISGIGMTIRKIVLWPKILLPETQEAVLIRNACHKFPPLFSSFILNDLYMMVRVRSMPTTESSSSEMPIDIIIAFANDGKSQQKNKKKKL